MSWPRLGQTLNHWLHEQPVAVTILIAGGGDLADAVRESAQHYSLSDEEAHWQCIEAMTANSLSLAKLFEEVICVATWSDLLRVIDSSPTVPILFDSHQFLRDVEPCLPGRVLPHDWSVTSDSIAARLAEVMGAEELVLLKSADVPSTEAPLLAKLQYLDRFFPKFEDCRFRRRFVNLRGIFP